MVETTTFVVMAMMVLAMKKMAEKYFRFGSSISEVFFQGGMTTASARKKDDDNRRLSSRVYFPPKTR